MVCNQCGKPAIVQVGRNPLCIDCNLKLQQAVELEHARNVRELNYLADQMEATTGVQGVIPRYEVPKPIPLIVREGPMNFHNIKIDNSVVGSINTGEARNIDVALDKVRAGGNTAVAEALQKLTQAVLDAKSLPAAEKQSAIEHLSYLTEQAALPVEHRRSAMSKTVIEGLERSLSVAADLLHVWKGIKPVIAAVFGVEVH